MEEDILDIIYKIQEARSPKYFLWNIVKDMKWVDSKYNSYFLTGKKNDIVYFNYDLKKHILYYSFSKIHQILEEKYHLNDLNINKLVGDMVSEHTKIRVDTTDMVFNPFFAIDE